MNTAAVFKGPLPSFLFLHFAVVFSVQPDSIEITDESEDTDEMLIGCAVCRVAMQISLVCQYQPVLRMLRVVSCPKLTGRDMRGRILKAALNLN